MAESRYKDHVFDVTDTVVKTKKRSIRLDKIEQTRLSRPLIGAALALGLLCGAFVMAFERLLYAHEIYILLGAPLAFLPLTMLFGVLKLEHHALGGTCHLIGSYSRLSRVRAAIDEVLEQDAQ